MTAAAFGTLLKVVSVASSVVSVVSTYQAAQANEANYKAQKRSLEIEALTKEQNATAARQQAGAREEAQRRRTKQILASQRAGFSQLGMGLGGSYGDILNQSSADAELDALNTRYEGTLQAQGLLESAQQSRYAGQVAGLNAAAARRAGRLDTASALLAGATNTYGVFRKTNRKGG